MPTDFSPESEKGLRYAVQLAREGAGELLLVHVIEYLVYPTGLGVGPMILPAHEKQLREQLASALTELRQRAVPPELACRTLLLDGRPFRQIVQAAREHEADLIVIATRSYTGVKHVVLGSTAERVVREAPCPVLVVRERERDFVTAGTARGEQAAVGTPGRGTK